MFSFSLSDLPLYKKLVKDYLKDSKDVSNLHSGLPTWSRIESKIEESYYPSDIRNTLSHCLSEQYSSVSAADEKTISNINLLKDSRTFSVTTGHQLNLFSGPQYVLIKIAQTIALAHQLKLKFPGYNFVPIYWMATEDHDVEEINHFYLFGKKIEWNALLNTVTGRLKTHEVAKLKAEVIDKFSSSQETVKIVEEIFDIYSSSRNLAEAMRQLVHNLFPESGVVVLDPNNPSLKSLFIPLMKKEVTEKVVYKFISKTNDILTGSGYHVQINPREINLFYIGKDWSRKRIVANDQGYSVLDSTLKWSETELLKEIENSPERFSPNALFRPVYQEHVLPNLMTIGGPGEVAYWLQLKSLFSQLKVSMPLVLLRNSHAFLRTKEIDILTKHNLSYLDLFTHSDVLTKDIAKQLKTIDLSNEGRELEEIIAEIQEKVVVAHSGLKGRSVVFKNNILKEFKGINDKLIKSTKEKNNVLINRVLKVKNAQLPDGGLAERKLNFLDLLVFYSLEEICEKFYLLDEEALEPKLYVHIL